MKPEDLDNIREVLDDLDIITSYIGVDQEMHDLSPNAHISVKPENENLRYLLGMEQTH